VLLEAVEGKRGQNYFSQTVLTPFLTPKELEKIHKENRILFEMVCSYGCDLAAIAGCNIDEIRTERVNKNEVNASSL